MGRTAVVVAVDRTDAGHDIQVDPGGGADVSAGHFDSSGDDSPPLPGDLAAISRSSGTGREHVTGYHDPNTERVALDGEKRIYGRDANGKVVGEVHIKRDGSAVVKNAGGAVVTLNPDGSISVNGGKVTPTGDFITAAGVSLDLHVHPTALGPSGPPTPGPPPT